MSARGTRVSTEWLALREPADAAARAPRPRRTPRATRSRRAGRWVIHDLGCGTGAMGRWLAPLLPGPQHWVVHDRDADLLEVAAADLPGRAADGAAVTVETQALRHHPAAAGRSRRREPHHRLGAAGHADRGRVGRAGHRLRRRGMPGAADPVRRRSRRADPGGSTGPPCGRRVQRPPAPRDASAAACSARTPSRVAVEEFGRLGARGPRPGQPLATRRRAGRPGGGVAQRVGGCCVRAAGRAGRRDRRAMRADVWRRQRAGRLAVTVDHADLLVLP